MNKMIESLDKIFLNYKTKTRSVGICGCVYKTDSTGAMCGVGSMLKDEALHLWHLKEADGGFAVKTAFRSRMNPDRLEINDWIKLNFRPEFHNLTLGELSDLQDIHDYGENYTDDGLSPFGKDKYDLIKVNILKRIKQQNET